MCGKNCAKRRAPALSPGGERAFSLWGCHFFSTKISVQNSIESKFKISPRGEKENRRAKRRWVARLPGYKFLFSDPHPSLNPEPPGGSISTPKMCQSIFAQFWAFFGTRLKNERKSASRKNDYCTCKKEFVHLAFVHLFICSFVHVH